MGLAYDRRYGQEDGNIRVGHEGDDALSGGAGNDTIGGGNDKLSSDNGNDSLTGSAGNDGLYGKADNDALDCGSNTDVWLRPHWHRRQHLRDHHWRPVARLCVDLLWPPDATTKPQGMGCQREEPDAGSSVWQRADPPEARLENGRF